MDAPITITLPDGSHREYPAGTTAADVAGSIGRRLAKAAVAAVVDGRDLGAPHCEQLTRLMNLECAFNDSGIASPIFGIPAEMFDCCGPAGLRFLKKKSMRLTPVRGY